MNPSSTATKPQDGSLFKNLENWTEFEKGEPDNTEVTHTDEHRQEISNHWNDFYNLKTENISEIVAETPASRIEITETIVESYQAPKTEIFSQPDIEDIFNTENLKGNGSSLEDAGFDFSASKMGKGAAKNLFGALSIFGEIFMDTLDLVKPKKAKKKEHVETDPAKAQKAAEKKAENMRKQGNIKAFYEGLKAQVGAAPNVDAVRMDDAEKSNINKTAKIGQESYKGIKDSFGRLTVYASSMFEVAIKDEDKKAKKQEKEMKIASAGGAPDMNMDKVAEGGYLSSTGGQGAG